MGCSSSYSDPSGEETLSVQVPDSITSWVAEAVGLSAAWGLGIAEPTLLKTFKPFFVDFMLPHHVVRGEQAKIPLSIYNYMGACTEVLNPLTTAFPVGGVTSMMSGGGGLGSSWGDPGGAASVLLRRQRQDGVSC